jgi:hypothetical protein
LRAPDSTTNCDDTSQIWAIRHSVPAFAYHRQVRQRHMAIAALPGGPMPAVTLRIDSLAYGGDAIARAEDGRCVFVTGGCPGDTVSAEIAEDHGNYL